MKKIAKAVAIAVALSSVLSLFALKYPLFGVSDGKDGKITKHAVKTDEMRALWVPYMSLELSDGDNSYEAFKNKFDEIITTAAECDLNTLIVHVRPFCDALYKSDIFPASHILSGEASAPSFAKSISCEWCPLALTVT